LLAVHLACRALLNYECDLAIAGGAAVHSVAEEGYLHEEGNIFSPDGHCRAFDAEAKGTIAGSGAGMVALKRLEDALADGDHIIAVVRGSAANNDGAGKIGYTAPSVSGQAEVLTEAYALSQTPTETVSYIEAHGTGTVLGDPIELRALHQAFASEGPRAEPCMIGSLKTNIGHTGTSAGVLGLIKAALACERGVLPPTLHYRRQNPMFPLEQTPFRINDAAREWRPSDMPRRAGVSSFGIGGTNVHVVLEQPPQRAQAASEAEATPKTRLWPVSARNEDALKARLAGLSAWFAQHPNADLACAAYTLQQGREHHDLRLAVIADTRDALIEMLDAAATVPARQARDRAPVAFLFPGQGAQHFAMLREVYANEPVFREHFDACAEQARALDGIDLHALIRAEQAAGSDGLAADAEATQALLNQTRYAQPALFAVEYALAKLWMDWGIQPRIMLGHSLGEYVCACLAGTLSRADAIRLVLARARLMQSLPAGAMLAVTMDAEMTRRYLGDAVWLAAHNAREQVVFAGTPEAIAALQATLAAEGIEVRPLRTSHAFHSGLVEPALAAFEAEVRKVRLQAPTIPWISNITGRAIEASEATDPRYWVRHMREPVRFCAGLDALAADGDDLWLEVGPGQTLSALAKRHLPERAAQILPSQPRAAAQPGEDHRALLQAAARLWEYNASLDFGRVRREEAPGRIPLPTYPWQRRQHWIEPTPAVVALMRALAGDDSAMATATAQARAALQTAAASAQTPAFAAGVAAPANATTAVVLEVLRELFGLDVIGADDDFFELGGDSLLATRFMSRLNARLGLSVSLKTFLERPTARAMAGWIDAVIPESARGLGDIAPAQVLPQAQEREVGVL
jgi:acyl transferase domain-containing protein